MAAKKNKEHSDSYAKNSEKNNFLIDYSLFNTIKDERDQLILRLFGETGCTSNELVNIKFEDINFNNDEITIKSENTKNKTQRSIPISQKLSGDLRSFCTVKKTYIFSSKKSPKLRTRSIRKIFEKYSNIFGAKITTSDLRKLFIQNSISNNEPIENIKKKVGIKRLDKKEFLTKNEFDKIKKFVENKRDELILDIIFETGCTLKESVNIKINDIEFTKNLLTIKANRTKRICNISKKLSLQIKKFILENKSSNFLFSTRQSKTISDKRIFQIIKEYSKKANLIVNPKILRYTHIAYLLSIGKNLEEISRQTGIKNLQKFHLYGNLGINKRNTFRRIDD